MRLTAAVLAAMLSAGCASGTNKEAAAAPVPFPSVGSKGCTSNPVPLGEAHVSMTSGGQPRTFIRHVAPPSGGPYLHALVVDLHGYTEGAEVHVVLSGLGAYGDTHGFDTVTPQGSGNPVRWDTGLDSADMNFIGDLLTEAERTMCIDRRRVFVTGLSNGAFMTSAVACILADRVAAVAPVAGVRNVSGCHPSRPMPVVAFHGTADRFVAYDGGLGQAALDLPAPDGSGRTLRQEGVTGEVAPGSSIPDIATAWAVRNGCGTVPAATVVAADVDLLAYRCPAGAEVELYRVTGGGHAWPGSPISAAVASVIGHTTMSISANDVMWRFFQRHPLPKVAPAR